MKRTKLPRKRDERIFRQTASKTKSINTKLVKRGGIRL